MSTWLIIVSSVPTTTIVLTRWLLLMRISTSLTIRVRSRRGSEIIHSTHSAIIVAGRKIFSLGVVVRWRATRMMVLSNSCTVIIALRRIITRITTTSSKATAVPPTILLLLVRVVGSGCHCRSRFFVRLLLVASVMRLLMIWVRS